MRRGIIAFDRIAGLLVAIVLIGAGAAALGWRYDLIPNAPDRIRIVGLTDLPSEPWWPWATAAGSVLLIVLGLTWLTRHLPHRRVGQLRLPGCDATGRLSADANAAVNAAAQIIAMAPGVRDGSGHVVLDRGQLVAELHCTLEPAADLTVVHVAAQQAAADLHRVLGREDLYHRIELRVARTDRTPTPRVG
ncbi:hypothetical protein GCM10009630_10090 [Kribbella jejuensis]|uniref:Uncharacterized protein n=1 Tax=Kribbella jejuensis TaxID=236068 RepID=A0A542EA98_9ACTN|nr:hypothetical protein [Kribbella jejuensis]TQJ12241.1 hypothetical protein FB475_5176 [Kribbella jejuensis]